MSSTSKELKESISKYRKYISDRKAELNMLDSQIKEKEEIRKKSLNENHDLLVMKELIDQSCEEARKNGRDLLSKVATNSVQSVFGNNTEVRLVEGKKGGIPTVEVKILKHIGDKIMTIEPRENDSGGLIDIIALSIFMAFGEMVKDNYALNIYDEPTKFVNGEDLVEKSSKLIKNIVEYNGKQTILTTNDELLAKSFDNKYRMVIDADTGVTTAYHEEE